MSSKNSELMKEKLSRALPVPTEDARPRRTTKARPIAAVAAQQSTRAPKLSVSLYHSDLKRLDQIKRYMNDHGVRTMTDSQALRLAVRSLELGEHLMSIYATMQSEDGRRRAS